MTELEFGHDEPVQNSWPELNCYGCGPANAEGLQLKSYLGPDAKTLVATVVPEELFTSGAPNVMYGGHIASLIDCHSIWTAITFAYRDEDRVLGSTPRIAYVTGQLCVNYHEPTPLDQPIHLTGRVEGDVARKTTIQCDVGPEGSVTATGEVLAVRANPDDVVDRHQAAVQFASDVSVSEDEET